MIAVTQPRRIAAMSISKRIAEEMGSEQLLGKIVGFNVRYSNCTSSETKILLCTEGILMREILSDPLLLKYAVIMVDEAHEKNINSDLLLSLLKKIMVVRKDLRVVISSATIDADEFRNFFRGIAPENDFSVPAVVNVSGRQFPVDIHCLESPCSDYVLQMSRVIQLIHKLEPPGDVLCFLTGREEIERLVDLVSKFENSAKSGYDNYSLMTVSIFGNMPLDLQMKVFSPAPVKTRKIVIATNIAENAVTIPGIKFVIDSGFCKMRFFSSRENMDYLIVVPIAKNAANQRAGRAGRIAPGKCYRLYTENEFGKMAEKNAGEMARSDLSSIILQLKSLQVSDVVHFDYFSRPSAKQISRGLELLFSLGAIDENSNLTRLGEAMNRLPLTPKLSKMLIESGKLNCSEEMLSIVAMLSVNDVFFGSSSKAVDLSRQCFAVSEGDHITLLNIYNSFVANSGAKTSSFCKQYNLNSKTLDRAVHIRKQLRQYLVRFGIPLLSSGGRDTDAIRRAVASGLFANSAKLLPDGTTYALLRGGGDLALSVHPNSALFRGKLPPFVVFGEIVHTSKTFINQVTPVSSSELLQVAPSYFQAAHGSFLL